MITGPLSQVNLEQVVAQLQAKNQGPIQPPTPEQINEAVKEWHSRHLRDNPTSYVPADLVELWRNTR